MNTKQDKLCHKMIKNTLKVTQFRFRVGRPIELLQSQTFWYVNKRKKCGWFILAIAGCVMGFLNGFFGGGGGMICVPILQNILRLEAKTSHATAIMVIFPLSVVSAVLYFLNGFVEIQPLLLVGAGVVVGGVVGSFALKVLPPKAVQIIFAIIMLAGGIRMLI